jgi:N-acetylneuraminic acid mutarotase
MRKSVVLLLFFFFLVRLCAVEVKSVSAVAEDSWATLTPMPTARSMLGVAVVDGKIYAIGGISGTQNILGTNEVYDPKTNTWSSKTPMPTHRHSFGISVFQNKIYCIGGATTIKSDGYVTNVNEVYDPTTDTWENKTSMPNPRSHLEATNVGNKIYLIGGQGRGDPRMFIVKNYTSLNEVYDPATDAWTTKTPIPNATAYYASALVDDKIYVMGGEGRSVSGLIYLNQVYDVKTDVWSLAAAVPGTILNGAVAGATTGENAPKLIYVIGGYYGITDPNKPYNYTNQVYNPKNNSWSFAAYMPIENYHYSVVVFDDMLYVIGGSSLNNTVPYAYNLRYTPIGYGTPDTSTPSPSPEPRQTGSFPILTVVVVSTVVVAVGAGLLVYFRKHRRQS